MHQQSLFERPTRDPLASRMRPRDLREFVGQQQLLGPGKVLRRLIDADNISSMIFWGPPGVGKTTLARIIAGRTHARFVTFSAVTSGIKEIKGVMEAAEDARLMGETTILFVDEIHRFNRSQQDAFLPWVEKGSIVLVGATTENPSFEVNAALLSRCKVFVLEPLAPADVESLLRRTLHDARGFGGTEIEIDEEALATIAAFANGDARTALNTLEMAVLNGEMQGERIVVKQQVLQQVTSRKLLLYDKDREEHYNIISALHKSMRNSDVDAAIYWLARMLEAGEDPLYVARRVVRFASEDIGMADSAALPLAVAAYQACHFLGMPECNVHLTHAVTYCALAPKSNALYLAYGEAKQDAQTTQAQPVPAAIRNAPTRLMQDLGYGKGYEYAHDYDEKLTGLQCLPDELEGREYYRPAGEGREAKVREWLQHLRQRRKKLREKGNDTL